MGISADCSENPPKSDQGTKERLLFAHRLQRLLGNMLNRMQATAMSLGASSGQDLAAAFCDLDARVVAQAGADPVLSGSLGPQVAATRDRFQNAARDAIVLASDPGLGGLDTATLTLVTALYGGAEHPVCGYLALRVRYPVPPFGAAAELALGTAPLGHEMSALPPAVGPRYVGFQVASASSGAPRTLDDEGRRQPPTLLTDALLREVARFAPCPRERLSDLLAQRAALRYGLDRLRELLHVLGDECMQFLSRAVLLHSEEACRQAIARLPEGIYAFADSLDSDAAGQSDVAIRVTCMRRGDKLEIDLRESDDAVKGPMNLVAPAVLAVIRHVLWGLLPADVAANDGLLGPVQVHLRPGSLLAAPSTAALLLGVDETARRLADVLCGALAQALPQTIAAAGAGTTSSLYLSFPRLAQIHRERLAGGCGAIPAARSSSGALRSNFAVHSLSAELLERRLPLRVLMHGLRRDSGGTGIHPGGIGEVRELELLSDADVSLAGERRRRPPYGLAGGGPGLVGHDTIQRPPAENKAPREAQPLPSKVCFHGRAGDRLRIESPGGGGHGDAHRAAYFAAL